jgi:predicted dehydrogenase
MPIRIGFADYKLENYHANIFLKHYRGALKDRGATVAGCFALDAEEGKAWAKKNDVAYFDTPEQLDAQVDAYCILAPSNPELHLKLAQLFAPFGKPMYIDKTFAPDEKTAKEIFAVADKHNAPLQTTSALRYTNVQQWLREHPGEQVKHMITWGGGRSFDEYAIHPLELLISCMGPDATHLLRRGSGELSQLILNFTGDRTGVANVYIATQTPYVAAMTTAKETQILTVPLENIFLENAAAVLELFETKKPNVDRRETLILHRIMDVARDPAALKGFVAL